MYMHMRVDKSFHSRYLTVFYFSVIWCVYRIISTQTHWKRFVGANVDPWVIKRKHTKTRDVKEKSLKLLSAVCFWRKGHVTTWQANFLHTFLIVFHTNKRLLSYLNKIIKGKPKGEWTLSGGVPAVCL